MASPGIGSLRTPLLLTAIADETTGTPVNCLGYTHFTVYAIGAGTINAGVITIETADFNPATASTYTGTWSSVTTMNAVDVTGGAQKHAILTEGAYSQIRARISTAVGGGGSVSVVLVGA